MKIVIRTHNRVAEIQKKTFAFLRERGIGTDNVHLVVSSKEQCEKYRRIPDFCGGIWVAPTPGLMAAQDYVERLFPAGTEVLQIDDDIEDLYRLIIVEEKKKLVRHMDLEGLVAQGFEECRKAKTTLWGIYPVTNPFFMSEHTTYDLRFIIANFNGFISLGEAYPKNPYPAKEDWWKTIDTFLRCGSVVRFNNYCTKSVFAAKGGAIDSNPETFKIQVATAKQMAIDYPQFVRLRKKKSFGGLDIRLVNAVGEIEDEPEVENVTEGTLF